MFQKKKKISYSKIIKKVYCVARGGMRAISVASDVCGTSLKRGMDFTLDRNRLFARAALTIFCHASHFYYGKKVIIKHRHETKIYLF